MGYFKSLDLDQKENSPAQEEFESMIAEEEIIRKKTMADIKAMNRILDAIEARRRSK